MKKLFFLPILLFIISCSGDDNNSQVVSNEDFIQGTTWKYDSMYDANGEVVDIDPCIGFITKFESYNIIRYTSDICRSQVTTPGIYSISNDVLTFVIGNETTVFKIVQVNSSTMKVGYDNTFENGWMILKKQ